MRSDHILLFIFPFIIRLNYSFCFLKKSKDTLENYIIDVFFTNSLTIIRCNPYEHYILRDITIETIGYIKCSNTDLFLPDDHIEFITLLQWDSTRIKCEKKKNIIKEEKTYLNIKHQAKNAFKKLPFQLIRVGSTGESKLHWEDKHSQLYFEHIPRKSLSNNEEEKDEQFRTEVYSFKNRPILCREKQVPYTAPCSNSSQPRNFSYVCYYKIGVAEPPTIAEMQKELKTLPVEINPDDDSTVNLYINKTPKQKIPKMFFMIAIGIFILIIIIASVTIYLCYCRSENEGSDEKVRRINSNTSIASNVS